MSELPLYNSHTERERTVRTGEVYRGTSLIRKRPPLGPYRRPMRRAQWFPQRGGRFLTSEVPLANKGTHRTGVPRS